MLYNGGYIMKKIKYILAILLVFTLGVSVAQKVQAMQSAYVCWQWDEVTHYHQRYPYVTTSVQNQCYKTIRFKNYYTSKTSSKDITKWYNLGMQIIRKTKTFTVH